MYSLSFLFILLNSVHQSGQCVFDQRNPFQPNKFHIAALVLARGGSKGIPLKNLALVRNETLLTIALKQIVRLPFDSVWVSTEDFRIYDEVQRGNRFIFDDRVNIHWRSQESATDEATSIFAVADFLAKKYLIDAIALIQCTSPFVKRAYLQEALDAFRSSTPDCVFSVTRSYKLRWRAAGDKIVPVNFDPGSRPRRQDWDGELVENGMFYFARRRLLEHGLFQNNK